MNGMACGFPSRVARRSGRCCPSSAADLFGSRSWRATIATQHREIAALLADSPSLRATLPRCAGRRVSRGPRRCHHGNRPARSARGVPVHCRAGARRVTDLRCRRPYLLTASGRVGMWRGGVRSGISVAAPFVWRCLNGLTIAPFPHPPHRTWRANFPHHALGQDVTLSSTARRAQAGSGVRARSTRRGARVDKFRPCSV